MNAPPTDRQTTGRLPAQRRRSRPSHRRDVLDVTLHDDELQAEMELIALLMVAVNDTADAEREDPLPQDQIDQLLGLC